MQFLLGPWGVGENNQLKLKQAGVAKGRVHTIDFLSGATVTVTQDIAKITISGGGGSFDPVTDPFILAIRG